MFLADRATGTAQYMSCNFIALARFPVDLRGLSLRDRQGPVAPPKNRHDPLLAEAHLHQTSPDRNHCQKDPLANVSPLRKLTVERNSCPISAFVVTLAVRAPL